VLTMAEDPAKTAVIDDVARAIFAALDDPELTKADITKGRERWPFDGLQMAAYKLELGPQAQSKAEIEQMACQMVAMRNRVQKADKLAGQHPEDEGVAEMRADIDDEIGGYRRMVESFLRGGPREHIKDMK
jgi:hypothetical protein